jgi:glycerate dehydrogenase
VLSQEPPVKGSLLIDNDVPNLIITPHSAWIAVEARQRLIGQMVENISAFLDGKALRRVN